MMNNFQNNLELPLPDPAVNLDELLQYITGDGQLAQIKSEELAVNLENLPDQQMCQEGSDKEDQLKRQIIMGQHLLVKKHEHHLAPKTQPSFICNDDYGGEYGFEVYINPHHGKKSPWMYSNALEKIFITMNQSFPIDFKWDLSVKEKLYVRATPAFSSPQHAQELVTRCIHHALSTDVTNKDYGPEIWDHIIRCNHTDAIYCGSKKSNQHLSVLMPLRRPQPGSHISRCNYQFVCKNSCVTGMNRRPIEVVFTLENEGGEIKGRRMLGVRICSCPKRDKDKEEQEQRKDKAMGVLPPTPVGGTKRKLEKKATTAPPTTAPLSVVVESRDTEEYLVQFKIIGKENQHAVLRYGRQLMAENLQLMGDQQNGTEQPYKKCFTEISKQIDDNIPK